VRLRKLWYDTPEEPPEGALLVSMTGHALYRIVSVRRMDSTVSLWRWALLVFRTTLREVDSDDVFLPLYWNRRARRAT
jgi:uncharacterized protein (DUF2267 family)